MAEAYDSPRAEAAARLERLRGFLQADPDNVSLLAECTDLGLGLGLAKEAHGWAERAVRSAPADSYLLARLASAKLALGDAKRIGKSIRTRPRDAARFVESAAPQPWRDDAQWSLCRLASRYW
jgi:predicted Zn-dependent protease